MPCYEYYCTEAPGQPVELMRSVAQRDCPVNAIFTGHFAGNNRPIYELPESGQRLVLERAPAHIHDVISFVRVTVPKRLNVIGLKPEPSDKDLVMAGFRYEEDRHGTVDMKHHLGEFTPQEIKRIWDEPEVPEVETVEDLRRHGVAVPGAEDGRSEMED